jgi:hypothetical protein
MKRSSGNTENWRLEKRLQETGGRRTEPAGGAGRAERARRLHVTHAFTVSNSVHLDAAEKAADFEKTPAKQGKTEIFGRT